MTMEYLSKQRYDELAAELKQLIEVVYPKVTDDLAEASAQGDRSDNAGYREARRIQAKTISRIRFLQRILENSRVIDPDALPKDRVSLLSKVEFTNLSTNTRMKFEIVSPHEMDLEAGKISLKSPIGAALVGRKVGEIVEAQVPSGTLRLRIESITNG
jgi:transcription elongation factor GreA